jgi:hypothetical protein
MHEHCSISQPSRRHACVIPTLCPSNHTALLILAGYTLHRWKSTNTTCTRSHSLSFRVVSPPGFSAKLYRPTTHEWPQAMDRKSTPTTTNLSARRNTRKRLKKHESTLTTQLHPSGGPVQMLTASLSLALRACDWSLWRSSSRQ